jgi:integrase
MKLTQTGLARLALPKGATDKIFFDDELPGFGLRIREGGSRKFVLHYRQGTGQKRLTIGPASVLTLDEARRKARKAMVAVDDGKDPNAEKATKRAAAGLLFSAVKDDYLAHCDGKLKPRYLVECRRHLNRDWKPLHRMAVANVDRHTVAARLRSIASESGATAANRARSTLSTLYGWAIGEGLCEANPVTGTNVNAETGRERVLTDAELVAIWQACPDNAYGRIVRLLMLTAQRRDEIGALAWSEVEEQDALGTSLIALPGERTKNGRPHAVPLSTLALESLTGQPRVVGRALVFGEGEGGFSGWSKSKERLDKASGVTGWRLHDLRRTAATRMADLGVAPHVVEAILNHISGHKAGVAGIYNKAMYLPEKRAALDLWADHVQLIVAQATGANVTKLPKRKARG